MEYLYLEAFLQLVVAPGHKLFHHIQPEITKVPLSKQSSPYADSIDCEHAIIDASAVDKGHLHIDFLMLRKSCKPHHHGLVGLQISDRKFVNQTTEIILRSMILMEGVSLGGL